MSQTPQIPEWFHFPDTRPLFTSRVFVQIAGENFPALFSRADEKFYFEGGFEVLFTDELPWKFDLSEKGGATDAIEDREVQRSDLAQHRS